MQIPVIDDITLGEFRATDKSVCVARIGDRAIADSTLRIPFPYADEHFDQWQRIVAESQKQYGEPIHFAIRQADELIGGIGFDELVLGHRAEIGYWLARDWWGQGIMTNAVRVACRYAVSKWCLVRITAHVFPSNSASVRVLEKNGFLFEGLLRKHHLKNGKFLDSRLYALVS